MLQQMIVSSTFEAPGIYCQGCANTIKRVLLKVPGVHGVTVDIAARRVTVEHEIDDEAVQDSLRRAGFPARLNER